VVRHVLHRLEPIIRVTKLSNDKSIVWISVVTRVLKPMLVPRKFSLDQQRMIEAFAQVSGLKEEAYVGERNGIAALATILTA
jgi:hypothetical protein